MNSKTKTIKIIFAIIFIMLSGCATHQPVNPQDPYEAFNRSMFVFNRTVDKWIILPGAEIYDAILPNPAKTGISNVFSNLSELPNVANDLLQLKPAWALSDIWRFIINSTVGIGGLLDIAKHVNLPHRTQDLGLTFAKWGAKNSPYIVIPILGPSTVRDGVALFTDYALFMVYPHIDPTYLRWGILTFYYISIRADLLPTEKLIKQAFDPYVFVRDAYLQRRAHLIKGGKNDEDTYVE